jgi:hypothetical protein
VHATCSRKCATTIESRVLGASGGGGGGTGLSRSEMTLMLPPLGAGIAGESCEFEMAPSENSQAGPDAFPALGGERLVSRASRGLILRERGVRGDCKTRGRGGGASSRHAVGRRASSRDSDISARETSIAADERERTALYTCFCSKSCCGIRQTTVNEVLVNQ